MIPDYKSIYNTLLKKDISETTFSFMHLRATGHFAIYKPDIIIDLIPNINPANEEIILNKTIPEYFIKINKYFKPITFLFPGSPDFTLKYLKIAIFRDKKDRFYSLISKHNLSSDSEFLILLFTVIRSFFQDDVYYFAQGFLTRKDYVNPDSPFPFYKFWYANQINLLKLQILLANFIKEINEFKKGDYSNRFHHILHNIEFDFRVFDNLNKNVDGKKSYIDHKIVFTHLNEYNEVIRFLFKNKILNPLEKQNEWNINALHHVENYEVPLRKDVGIYNLFQHHLSKSLSNYLINESNITKLKVRQEFISEFLDIANLPMYDSYYNILPFPKESIKRENIIKTWLSR